MVDQGVADLAIEELEDPVALVDQRDLGVQRGEDRRILDADGTGPDDRHRTRDRRQREDAGGVDDGAAVDRDSLDAGRHGADGDDDMVGLDVGVAVIALDPQPVGVEEGRLALNKGHAVAAELVLHDLDFVPNDLVESGDEVLHRQVLLEGVADAVDVPLAKSREVEHGLPKGFAGNGAGVDRRASDVRGPLDHHGALAQLGGLDGGAVTGGTRPDNRYVVSLQALSPFHGARAGRSRSTSLPIDGASGDSNRQEYSPSYALPVCLAFRGRGAMWPAGAALGCCLA